MKIDRRISRGALVLGTVFLSLALAGPVVAKSEKINFLPGTDVSSWYWERQVDEEVTTPVPVPPPVPPASQRVRLPNPQRPDTLPVALANGESERMSAVKFELVERGVTEGSEVKEFVLYIEESIDRNEQPQVAPDQAKIQACLLVDLLTQGEEEKYDDAPKWDEKECVEGTRDAPEGAPAAVWTFDLTKIAQPWGENPFNNNGVMLMPVIEAGKSWQVNLKVPRKDAVAEEGDQYELTKNRAFITLDYIPGEPPDIPEPPPVPADPTGTTTTGTTTVPPTTGGVAGSPVIGPSTDITGAGSDLPGAETPPAVTPTEIAGFSPFPEAGPRMPAYVWLAIPLGLLGLSAVRSVILEPVGGPRPDGVISAIRRRNAERRGQLIHTERSGLFARFGGGMRRAFGGVTRIVRRNR